MTRNLARVCAALAAGLILLVTGAAVQAGAVGGPKANSDRVLAHTTDVYPVAFCGGELAEVVVSGDHDTDLDLYVYDEFGNLVASDTDGTDVCLAQWFPCWTGTYRIEVRNLGGVYNQYQIGTN